MQMGAAGEAAAADAADSLAQRKPALAASQGGGDAAEMGVAGAGAVGVQQFDHEAVRALPPQQGDAARRGGADPGAGRGGQVDAAMHLACPRAEGRGDAGGADRVQQGWCLLARRRGGGEQEDGNGAPQLLVAGWKVPMELPPSQEMTAPVM